MLLIVYTSTLSFLSLLKFHAHSFNFSAVLYHDMSTSFPWFGFSQKYVLCSWYLPLLYIIYPSNGISKSTTSWILACQTACMVIIAFLCGNHYSEWFKSLKWKRLSHIFQQPDLSSPLTRTYISMVLFLSLPPISSSTLCAEMESAECTPPVINCLKRGHWHY